MIGLLSDVIGYLRLIKITYFIQYCKRVRARKKSSAWRRPANFIMFFSSTACPSYNGPIFIALQFSK